MRKINYSAPLTIHRFSCSRFSSFGFSLVEVLVSLVILAVGVLGVTVGLIGAAGLTRFLEAILYGIDPLDPQVFTAVAAFLLLIVVASSMGPAVRASRLDPVRSLKCE